MTITLLSSKSDDKAFFEGAAKLAGLPFVHVPNPEAACDALIADHSTILVFDAASKEAYQAFEKALSEKIGLFSEVVNANHIFAVCPGALHEAPYLIQSDVCGHFIERSFTEESKAIMGRLFSQALAERAFGLEKYFGPVAKTQILTVTKSSQKKAIVESLRDHLLKIGFKSRMAAVIATATDELIMNAIFDAPVDEMGKHIYAQTPRSTELALAGKNIVEVKIGFDGKVFGLSVSDQHGSLNKKKLLAQHLGKSYMVNEYETRTTTVGAGLGLATVYRNCGGMIFSCESGGRTEVTLFFNKTDSFKDFKDQFRFLSTFTYFP
jgi:hypothetical protein